ncbi:MAG: energy transducer TonB [Bacteroidota bacterium]
MSVEMLGLPLLFDLALTGSSMLLAMVGLIVGIIVLIIVMRSNYAKNDPDQLKEKYAGASFKSPLEGRNKYPDVDAFKLSGTFLNVGLLVALGLTILAFSWTEYEKEVIIPDDALEIDDDIEIEPPRTAEPPPPPPPPPPPVIEEVPEEEIEEEEEPEFVDQSVEEETEIIEPEPVEEAPPPPPTPPPPPPQPEVEEIFQVVEEMPRFPGCENESDKNKRKDCANKKMLEFIYKNIKYPPIARENGVEGTVVIRFVVGKDGSVEEPTILRDIGAQCGSEAMRVVKMMNSMGKKWVPGKQRGKPVKVYFNLPVKFRLE